MFKMRASRLFGKFALVGALLFSAGMAVVSCDDAIRVYDQKNIAPSFSDLRGDALFDILGPTIIDKGVNFAVYSQHATRIEVLIFDSENPETDLPVIRIPMTKRDGSHIWTVFVYGVGVGTHYGYVAWGPNWPYREDFYPGSNVGFISDCDAQGNRFNPNKLLIDPYARRIHRDFDWSAGNPASGSARAVSTWKAAAKSVVINSKYVWSEHETQWRTARQSQSHKGHDVNDLIIYEVHPYGFTARALDVSAPGSYRAIGEKAGYLKDLGVTAVELLPVMEKTDDGGYWGYNTLNFFTPEQRYSTRANVELNAVVDEFKEMVDKLHQAGIEVILDIVYNHTGEGGFWRYLTHAPGFDYGSHWNFDDTTATSIYSFRGLDNQSYYVLPDDDKCGYVDQTGVGNQVRTNAMPFKRLIIDNLRYWVEEMHVDGFRFDLASIMGVEDGTHHWGLHHWFSTVQNTVVQDIINDEVLQRYNTRLIAEPWDISRFATSGFPNNTKGKADFAWSEWSSRYKELMRRFVNEDGFTLSSGLTLPPDWSGNMGLGNALTGSSEIFSRHDRRPYHSINFVTAHDGFTLYDLVTYSEKRNLCGVLNPTCCKEVYNAFCNQESGANDNWSRAWCGHREWGGDAFNAMGVCDDPLAEAVKRQMIRNFFTLLMVSHGTPMILGGDEYMRTQYGNNNAFSDGANNDYNWFRWGEWLSNDANVRMHDFVRKVIRIRKDFSEFLAPKVYKDVDWRNPSGWAMQGHDWQGKMLTMHYPATDTTPFSLAVMINMDASSEPEFHFPGGGEWEVLLDTQFYFDHTGFLNDKTDRKQSYNVTLDGSRVVRDSYQVKSRTIVIARKSR
ncbi:MAG: alpha-amylase family glycosyl hydrolase [Proteobacteria bacterium]|nr:alpha-amylase family glycosyl hydrolase [Pseudomonadota bacterium]